MNCSIVTKQPLVFIKNVLDEKPELLQNMDQIGQVVKSAIKDSTEKIPSVNGVSLDQIPPDSVVKFRGMVQDMLDPEFYLGKYSAHNKHTNEKVSRYGCFTDTGSENSPEVIDFDAEENVTLERQTFYCVPIPGETKWIKQMYDQQKLDEIGITRDSKRKFDEDVDLADGIETENCEQTTPEGETGNSMQEKKMKTLNEAQTKTEEKKPKAPIDYAKNFPLPDEIGCAAFVKIYSKNTELKLNDAVEFTCVYSVDPQFASATMGDEMEHDAMVTWHDVNMVEEQAHCPPPSLVPRLHCLYFEKIVDLNPHVRIKDELYENVRKQLTTVRSGLMQILKQLLGGDALAAEYLLMHLISKVYGRVGGMCVGKMSLNLSKCPNTPFTQQLYNFLELVLEKSFYLPMTLDNLNNKRFMPSKDFEANRLTSGILQLSDETNLVLDETKMEPGKLDTDGVKNLTALGNLIQWQKLEYDFKFNRLDIETNLNVLVLSEGKSLLKCDCMVPIQSIECDQSTSLDHISAKLLEKFRLYLSVVRKIKYELSDKVQKALEDDFVEMRKEDSKAMNADAFYLLLTTARYMALSYGQDTLSSALWTRVKELNSELRKRLET